MREYKGLLLERKKYCVLMDSSINYSQDLRLYVKETTGNRQWKLKRNYGERWY